MLYYGIGIFIFTFYSIKNGYLVLDFRQTVFLFIIGILFLIQWVLSAQNKKSNFLIVMQIVVLLAYFFPNQFSFLEEINPKNMRRLTRQYGKLRKWMDTKVQSYFDKKNDDDMTVASTVDTIIDENEINEMRRLLEEKEARLRKRRKKEESNKSKRRLKSRKNAEKRLKKVRFDEERDSQVSKIDMDMIIDNIASEFSKKINRNE